MSAHEIESRIDRAINRADKDYLDGKLSREDWFARLGRIHIWADNMRTRIVFTA